MVKAKKTKKPDRTGTRLNQPTPAQDNGKVKVDPGNVPVLTIQLLNVISLKLSKMIELMEK